MDVAPAPQRKHAFRTLDGLRGIAALCVAAHHLPSMVGGPVFGGSYLAVDLFFLMSGFVISHAYDDKLRSGLGAGGFMRIRLIRLYPLYVISTLLMFAWLAAAVALGKSDYWSWPWLLAALPFALLILPSPPVHGIHSTNTLFLNPPAWSLFWELAINLVYAAFFRLFDRRGVIPAIIGASAIGLAVLAASHFKLDQGALWSDAPGGVFRVTFSFFLGVLMCRMHVRGALPHIPVPAWAVLLISVLLLVPSGEGLWRGIYDAACIFLLFPLLLIAAVSNEPRSRGLSEFCIISGTVSYALYVAHAPVEMVVTGVIRQAGGARFLSPMSAEFVALAAAVVASWVLARWIDPPARAALGRLFPRRS